MTIHLKNGSNSLFYSSLIKEVLFIFSSSSNIVDIRFICPFTGDSTSLLRNSSLKPSILLSTLYLIIYSISISYLKYTKSSARYRIIFNNSSVVLNFTFFITSLFLFIFSHIFSIFYSISTSISITLLWLIQLGTLYFSNKPTYSISYSGTSFNTFFALS